MLRLRKNQNGQMAIFVALIFQILFLFFAMAINIGLAVHDKINLQNAVDLAAYYAGQRQAEMLNVIAHTNYQIRQSWKLLNWRYYVLGQMGKTQPNPHPARPGENYPHTEDIWPPVADTPALCVTYHPVWRSMPGQDNPCQRSNFSVTNIKIPPVFAFVNPFNILLNQVATRISQNIARSCDNFAGYNWLYAASIYVAYMKDQQSRKELIRALARNLAKPGEQIVDLDGDLIFDGAKKTFEKNLTVPNQSSIEEFKIFNSLQDLKPSQWLNEIDTWFTLYYQELTGSAANCQSDIRSLYDLSSQSINGLQQILGPDSADVVKELKSYVDQAASFPPGNSLRLSIGVEKNPWYLAYMMVQAKTRPRQLFFPFGQPAVFKARAFVQPFGGRVGPWYGKKWARGATSSEGEPMQLAPAKFNTAANLNTSQSNLKWLVPQYSRFPGDRVGLKSYLSQTALRNQFGIAAYIRDYADITRDFGATGVNDVLASSDKADSNIRNYEIAAVVPDLFDITYYSIQPNFGKRYLPKLLNSRDRLGIPEIAYPRSDLGSRNKDAAIYFSVEDQILNSSGMNSPSGPMISRESYWMVQDKAHLLTSWVHNDIYGEYFDFPSDRFGKCREFDEKYKIKAPGSCLDGGGRSGYSVKFISPEMFKTPLPLGGEGQGPGLILNPPPD